ncbi:MAG: pseudouridine synthase [Pseudohongiellaceae bacterium]
MSKLVLFNKPYGVLSQFRASGAAQTLAKFIPVPGVYPAGRLDKDSEGLLLLTDDGRLQQQIADPDFKLQKVYQVQVEGLIEEPALTRLRQGIVLNDGVTRPALARVIAEPDLWPRNPPVRYRASIPTCWIEISIGEGRNRQIRRMTAAAGFPTLRLIRKQIGGWLLGDLQPGQYNVIDIPPTATTKNTPRNIQTKKPSRKNR